MDDLLWNKIFGGILGAWLLVMVLNLMIGPTLYHPHHLAEGERGYVIEVPDDAGHGAQAEAEVPLATMLANADLTKGERQMAKCKSCHTFDNGGKHSTGPNLWNVIQRGRATADFGNYSGDMKALGGNWDFETLYAYLLKPTDVVSKTNMSFAGFGRKKQDAANVVAYLNSLSDNPLPLPEAAPEPEEAAHAPEEGQSEAEAPEATPPATPEVPTPESLGSEH